MISSKLGSSMNKKVGLLPKQFQVVSYEVYRVKNRKCLLGRDVMCLQRRMLVGVVMGHILVSSKGIRVQPWGSCLSGMVTHCFVREFGCK